MCIATQELSCNPKISENKNEVENEIHQDVSMSNPHHGSADGRYDASFVIPFTVRLMFASRSVLIFIFCVILALTTIDRCLLRGTSC
jgi:hypothetical protein